MKRFLTAVVNFFRGNKPKLEQPHIESVHCGTIKSGESVTVSFGIDNKGELLPKSGRVEKEKKINWRELSDEEYSKTEWGKECGHLHLHQLGWHCYPDGEGRVITPSTQLHITSGPPLGDVCKVCGEKINHDDDVNLHFCDGRFEGEGFLKIDMEKETETASLDFKPAIDCPQHGIHKHTVKVEFNAPIKYLNGVYCHVCYMENALKGLPKLKSIKEENQSCNNST